MNLDLDHLADLERRATAAPWELEQVPPCILIDAEHWALSDGGWDAVLCMGSMSEGDEPDAQLIVALRNAAAELIAAARRARQAEALLREMVEHPLADSWAISEGCGPGHQNLCAYCGCQMDTEQHETDCLVARAVALLAT